MLTPALGRVARSTCAVSGQTFCAAHRPASVTAIGAASQGFRPSHQRRRSSSKASIPPDGSNGSSSATQQPKSGGTKSPAKKVAARESQKKAVAPALNIPSVKATNHLQQRDVNLSTFFSLHRPISITHPGVPPISTEEAFNSLFEPRAENNRRMVSDTLDTLSSSVEMLEAAMRPHEELDIRDEILQSSMSNADAVKHLDGIPQVSVDQLLSRLVPFVPPPAPSPNGSEPAATETKSKRRARKMNIQASEPQQRAWSTTVIVTESTDTNGQRTYSASTTPMVELEAPGSESNAPHEDVGIHQPFLDRMMIRQNQYNRYRNDRSSQGRADMLLISVKRQRKLKMKKHKYKKLMKRTRLLRRKLDKA